MKKFIVTMLFMAGLAPAFAKIQYIDEFDLSKFPCGLGKCIQPKLAVNGKPLTLLTNVYERGFGALPESAVVLKLNGEWDSFDAIVGIDDGANTANVNVGWKKAKAQFRIWADDRIVWQSGELHDGMKPKVAHVELLGVRELILESASVAWEVRNIAFCDWANARITGKTSAKAEVMDDSRYFRQVGILTPPEKPQPKFNGADIWAVRPGHPILFRVPVSGSRPMKFTSNNLPMGVKLGYEDGVLSGIAPINYGNYDILVRAENAKGTATKIITLAVGDVLTLTPPMGWNSWNIWGWKVTDRNVRDAAEAMDSSGLANYGWAYINLDDWWTNCGEDYDNRRKDVVRGPMRNRSGRIIPNKDFPDMKALADYIHSFGFKAGLYSSPGEKTCGGCAGSLGHEMMDAQTWAEWGFDYIKYDWCSYWDNFHEITKNRKATIDDWAKPYRLMTECLKKQNRDIVHSFCQYGNGEAHKWAREAGAQCWRAWEDLKDSWIWVEKAIDGRVNGEYWKFSGPGCFADPDMLVIGRQIDGNGAIRPTNLTANEQLSHVSIWAMVSAPLMIGCDLTQLSPFEKSLLVNDGVIAINQDRLGIPAKRIRHTDAESIWKRDLIGGDIAVALLNRSPIAREISFQFSELGIDGIWKVKDVWRDKCEGWHSGVYSAEILPHATKIIRLKFRECECD